MHFYTHNIGDFASQTRFMTPEEIGVYVILRDEYLYNGVPLVYDRITSMFPPEYEGALKRVLSRCFVEKDGVYTSDALDVMLDEYAAQAEKNRKNVQKRWEKVRKVKESNTKEYDSNTSGKESNTKAYLTNNHKPITNNIDNTINQSTVSEAIEAPAKPTDLNSCFQSFGSNPVSRPTQWEPDEDDFDQPLQNQIAQAQRIEVDISDDSHKLNASEMVVLAATLGYRITHNVVLDEIADERVITTAMFKEAIQRTKDNAGSAGYLIRILQNAIKDPDAFNGIRKKPDVTADTLSDGQAYHFAKSLANYHPWASNNAKYMETMEQMIDRVSISIKNPEFFNNCRWALEKLGLVKEAAA